MQLGRYQISTLQPTAVHSISFSEDYQHFSVASDGGYEIWKTWPLGLVRRRSLNGSLARALIIPGSALLVVQGGGTTPLYPPNKAVIYHDRLGKAIAELEFGERIMGIAVRNGYICVVLLRKTVAFAYDLSSGTRKGKEKVSSGDYALRKLGEWETAENEHGLVALSTLPNTSMLAVPGRQPGHVQLIHLPTAAVKSPVFRSPIILAHTHPLSTLTCTADGSFLTTTSERGTLLRVWDTTRGNLIKELRRGVDRAEMWGVQFEDRGMTGTRIVGWSDKGTIHIWGSAENPQVKTSGPTLTKLLSRNLPLPRYFSSAASVAQYRLPRKNPHAFSSAIGAAVTAAGVPSAKLEAESDEMSDRFVVGWIEVDEPVNDASPISTGQRGERRSFGSETTSQTATPTLTRPASRKSHRPTVRNSSAEGVESVHAKSFKSRQLIAITYSGDWYRLKIPDRVDDEEGEGKHRCELVEYRRLRIGGGGW